MLVWGMGHPLWTIVFLLLTLFLIWGLLQAIAQFAAGVWLGLGRLPIQLFRGIGSGLWWLIQRKPSPQILPTASPPTAQQRLSELLTELEQAQQEQQRLTKEIKELLEENPVEGLSPKLLQKILAQQPSSRA